MTTFEPRKRSTGVARWFRVAAAVVALLVPAAALATIDGITDLSATPFFTLTAREGYISIPDGASIYSWGFTTGPLMQIPGPTLIVNQNAVVTVTLTNALPAAAGNVSIVFPGHVVTSTAGGVPGPLAQEAPPGASVQYTFTAGEPGTYYYHSGSRPDLQVEMGLYGALIVRPLLGAGYAYNNALTAFDREYLFLLSEVDLDIHQAAELQAPGPGPIDVGTPPFFPEYWLINGRAASDTMAAAGGALLPTQPYNIVPRMEPGERLLMRVVGAGHDIHPYHHHGNHVQVLARDGRLITSETDPTKLAGPSLFTIPSVPGGTVDAIFEWTGKDLGWDIYGPVNTACTDLNNDMRDDSDPAMICHDDVCTTNDLVNNYTLAAGSDGFDDDNWEWCPDHGRPIPVTLPDQKVLTFGGFWGGSPYLGDCGQLPPGEGGLNPNCGFAFMWHSHTEREMVNNDVFPGGMMTMLIIEAPGTLP